MEVVSVNHEQMGKAFQGQEEVVVGWVGILIVWVHYSGGQYGERFPRVVSTIPFPVFPFS